MSPRPYLIAGFCSLAALTAVNAAVPSDPFRLTREIEPVAERVDLVLDPAQGGYNGRVVIDVIAHHAFTQFRLNAEGPKFSAGTLVDAAGEATVLKAAFTDAKLGIVTLTAPAELPAGDYRLTIDFNAPFRRDGLGLYKTVSHGDAYLFTQFEDKHARQAFPCWDEPEFKINWQLALTVPASLAAVTNAPVARETRNDTTKTLEYGRMPPMPAYLVALAVGPFETVPIAGMSVPGAIITPRGQAGLAVEAARFAPPLLRRLEQYFGIPYPYPKLDHVAVPEYVYGAMENAGMITYTAPLLLVDPEHASFSQRRVLANVMAHEMAHMWFGDLVTMQWWDDLWLNESFADWMCAKVVNQEYPEFRIMVQQTKAIRHAMDSDALPSISAIRRKVTAETDLAQLADELTYSKGKGILTMVENWIGPENFREAMRRYFLQHRWGNTQAGDLWAAFGSVSQDNIAEILAGFIEHPGVPLISITRDGDTLRFTQQRFTLLGNAPLPGQWRVPIVLSWRKNGQTHRERYLLTDTTGALAVPGISGADWIYPNAGESGYYRWQLSSELNAQLARKTAELTSLERVGLLDNTAALLRAGLINGTDYLAYIAASARDDDPDVNASTISMVEGVEETFVREATQTGFRNFRHAILRPILDRVGLQPALGEPSYNGALRASLLTALGRDGAEPPVVAECRRLATLFLHDHSAVDPSLLPVALSVSAYHGDAALFDAYVKALAEVKAPAQRSALIFALGGFHDPVLAARALQFTLTPALNSTEFLRPLRATEEDRDQRRLAADWIIRNYDAIAAKAPPEYVGSLIYFAEGAEPADFQRVHDFLMAEGRATEFARVNAAKTVDRRNARDRLREKEEAHVAAFLSAYAQKVPDGK